MIQRTIELHIIEQFGWDSSISGDLQEQKSLYQLMQPHITSNTTKDLIIGNLTHYAIMYLSKTIHINLDIDKS